MQLLTASTHHYKRLATKEVSVGDLKIGNFHPIRMQTMTTLDTMDTMGIVEQTIRCVDKGAELVRITAPSKKEAENLRVIKEELVKRGCHVPLVADIHFTPNAAMIAAQYIEKVRINPGNYVDKKKFELIEYTDSDYAEELERIRDKFIPLLDICKQNGTAMRIGTNHGSLSDRIMSRYGDTAIGMVESAMEFLRIARDEHYHNIVLSMKSSNPIVMVDAYRLLVKSMYEEFQELYPLHLGVTEAGDGEDGRVKSAAGIGTLLEDGIGDTIRVSLTEEPEEEIAVCNDLISRYPLSTVSSGSGPLESLSYTESVDTKIVGNIGGHLHPVVIADMRHSGVIDYPLMAQVGYEYNAEDDKWHIRDLAADYLWLDRYPEIDNFPGTLKCIIPYDIWKANDISQSVMPVIHYSPVDDPATLISPGEKAVVLIDDTNYTGIEEEAVRALNSLSVFIMMATDAADAVAVLRERYIRLRQCGLEVPVSICVVSGRSTFDQCLADISTVAGSLMMDFNIQGLMPVLMADNDRVLRQETARNTQLSGRNYTLNESVEAFLNNTSFSILQAVRKRITKTEYISCPSCGRTLFDLQETTAVIRQKTDHLKGIKIAIMGCIVNGPGEMADADFGYVGSGVGKITLYKGKEVVKRNIPSEVALDELINLLKEHDAWVNP